MAKYRLTCWGDEFEIDADMSQASAPVLVNGNSTPFQTADFRHDPDDMRAAYDAMDEGDLGPDCDSEIIAAGGIFVKD